MKVTLPMEISISIYPGERKRGGMRQRDQQRGKKRDGESQTKKKMKKKRKRVK